MTPRAYYNDNDPTACAWLRELIVGGRIASGDVDERSIKDVQPADLSGYCQAHFFAGIGGWSLALRLAGWDDARPVWTGSCPCQPISVAGRRLGADDPRHLWPDFHRLISECRPGIVFGEQIAPAARNGWIDAVFADLEGEGYACGAAVLGAHSVGAPHVRQRAYWVADSAEHRQEGQLREDSGVAAFRGGAPQTLDAWHGSGSPFEQWAQLLAEPNALRMADGVSSGLDIRPRLHAYGNAIVPQVAAAFIGAMMDAEMRRADGEGRAGA